MGAAPITVSWVSMAVLFLDALAMLSAWPFAVNGWGTLTLNVALYGGLSAAPLVYIDLFLFYIKVFRRATNSGTRHAALTR